jgi:hypothetical protein
MAAVSQHSLGALRVRPRVTCVPVIVAALAGCSDDGTAPAPVSVEPAYTWLSETGLYGDILTHTVAADVRAFEPTYALWSDGADKMRWVALPEGASIDTTDMNRWVLPVGARLWKEFSLAGTRLETRLIERYGSGPRDYWMGSFVWLPDGSDARFSELGEQDLLGTRHDVPARERCGSCHDGEPGRALGFSALQLARSPAALDLAQLAAEGRLSAPPAPDVDPAIVGEPAAAAALGYLHANCGNCHNPRGAAWPDTQMLLRLDVGTAGVDNVVGGLVNVPLQYYRAEDGATTLRLVPGRPEQSGLIARMNVRGPREQMPPLATELVDEDGVGLVSRWIERLPEGVP